MTDAEANASEPERETVLTRAKAAVDQGNARIVPKYEAAHALTNFPAESARGGLHSSHIYDSFKRIRKICFWGIVEALILS